MRDVEHTLLDWNQLHNKVESLRQNAGLDNNQQAFSQVVVEHLLDFSGEEALDAATDGSQDRGIDAVAIDDRDGKNDVHLFSFKYTSKFETSKKHFPGSEIDKVMTFISDVFSKSDNLKDSCNQLLYAKVTDIWAALERRTLPNFYVHFCGNMWPLNDADLKRFEIAVRPYHQVTVLAHGCSDIASSLIYSRRRPIARSIKLVDTHHFERTDGVIRGLIGITTAEEIVNLVKSDINPDEISVDLFDSNVRVYLTLKNKINKKIYETAISDNNYEFWYLNNGITVTCDTLSYPPKVRQPKVNLTNVQIVNGGQTTNALFEAYRKDADKVRDVLVLLRIYETREHYLSSRIAEATNSQTPIKSRDLRSNDSVQKKIEDMLSS